jgi:hypothetical protein
MAAKYREQYLKAHSDLMSYKEEWDDERENL